MQFPEDTPHVNPDILKKVYPVYDVYKVHKKSNTGYSALPYYFTGE